MTQPLHQAIEPVYKSFTDVEVVEEKLRTMPVQKPGNSKQTYGTPWEFIKAVEERFGSIAFDLAASAENAKAKNFWTEEENSLKQAWAHSHPDGNLWVNPPYANIRDWASKCAEESKKRKGLIFLLVPASVGSNWYADHVHQQSMVLALSPRLVFEGETSSFPKDLILATYGMGLKGFDLWRWK